MSTHTTRLHCAGQEAVVETAGAQAAHTRAVTTALRELYARRIAELERIRDDARDAYYAADAAVPGYSKDTDPEERARLRGLAYAAQGRYTDAERVLSGPEHRTQYGPRGAYDRLKPTVVPMAETPQQARREVRRGPVAPRPVTLPFAAGSWVGWTDPDGTVRRGVVVSVSLPDVPWAKNARCVLPDDGGDALAIGPGFARTVAAATKAGRWEVYGRSEAYPTVDTYTGVSVHPIPVPED